MAETTEAPAENGWTLVHEQPEETVVLSETQGRTQYNPPVLRAEKQINGSLVTVEAPTEELLQTRMAAVDEHVEAFLADPVGAPPAEPATLTRMTIAPDEVDPSPEEVEVNTKTVLTADGAFSEEEWSGRSRSDTIVTPDGQTVYSGVGDTEAIDEELATIAADTASAENAATTDPFGDVETQQVVYDTADAVDSPGQSAGGTLIVPAEADDLDQAVDQMTATSQQAENDRVLAATEAAERDQRTGTTAGPTQQAMAEEHATRLQAQASEVAAAREEGVSEEETDRRAREAGAAAVAEEDEGGPKATAGAQEAAEELGVDLDSVEGTGRGGQITKADVEQHANG